MRGLLLPLWEYFLEIRYCRKPHREFRPLAGGHPRLWRGISEIEIRPEVKYALDRIETTIGRAAPFEAAKMARGGFERRAIDDAFYETIGMNLKEYARRRRVFHAACRLIMSD